MTADRDTLNQNPDLLAAVRAAARQDQFLEVILPEEARRRFEGAIDQSLLTAETVRITQALGRVLASDLAAETDVPPLTAPASTASRYGRPTPSGRVIAHPDGFCSMRK